MWKADMLNVDDQTVASLELESATPRLTATPPPADDQPELPSAEALAGFATLLVFTSIDAEENHARFYWLHWQPTLWGEIALVQTWGRLGTAGRVRVTVYPDRADAHAAVVQIIRHRLRHGYEIVAWE